LHDTADLESRGVPSVYVATTEFQDAAAAQAKSLGADPGGIFVAHPIQDRTDAELQELAEESIEAIVSKLLD